MSAVNHPVHYNQPGKKECIVEMAEEFGSLAVLMFCVLNAYKYRYRKGHKDNTEQDNSKAEWYIAYANRLLRNRKVMRVLLCIFFPRIIGYIEK